MTTHRRGHHRGATLTGLTLIAAASIAIISLAGGITAESPHTAWPVLRLSPITNAAQRCTPIILMDEPIGVAPAEALPTPQERGEAGRGCADDPASVPAPATIHDYYAQNAVALQRSLDRQSLIDRISLYMGSVPAACTIPLMVDEGYEHGIDARLCAVTCIEESSGRGNLFGSLYGHPDGYEAQVRWYFDQVVRNGYTDTWRAAWFWHGGGSEGADHSFYADNVTRQVEGI